MGLCFSKFKKKSKSKNKSTASSSSSPTQNQSVQVDSISKDNTTISTSSSPATTLTKTKNENNTRNVNSNIVENTSTTKSSQLAQKESSISKQESKPAEVQVAPSTVLPTKPIEPTPSTAPKPSLTTEPHRDIPGIVQDEPKASTSEVIVSTSSSPTVEPSAPVTTNSAPPVSSVQTRTTATSTSSLQNELKKKMAQEIAQAIRSSTYQLAQTTPLPSSLNALESHPMLPMVDTKPEPRTESTSHKDPTHDIPLKRPTSSEICLVSPRVPLPNEVSDDAFQGGFPSSSPTTEVSVTPETKPSSMELKTNATPVPETTSSLSNHELHEAMKAPLPGSEAVLNSTFNLIRVPSSSLNSSPTPLKPLPDPPIPEPIVEPQPVVQSVPILTTHAVSTNQTKEDPPMQVTDAVAKTSHHASLPSLSHQEHATLKKEKEEKEESTPLLSREDHVKKLETIILQQAKLTSSTSSLKGSSHPHRSEDKLNPVSSLFNVTDTSTKNPSASLPTTFPSTKELRPPGPTKKSMNALNHSSTTAAIPSEPSTQPLTTTKSGSIPVLSKVQELKQSGTPVAGSNELIQSLPALTSQSIDPIQKDPLLASSPAKFGEPELTHVKDAANSLDSSIPHMNSHEESTVKSTDLHPHEVKTQAMDPVSTDPSLIPLPYSKLSLTSEPKLDQVKEETNGTKETLVQAQGYKESVPEHLVESPKAFTSDVPSTQPFDTSISSTSTRISNKSKLESKSSLNESKSKTSLVESLMNKLKSPKQSLEKLEEASTSKDKQESDSIKPKEPSLPISNTEITSTGSVVNDKKEEVMNVVEVIEDTKQEISNELSLASNIIETKVQEVHENVEVLVLDPTASVPSSSSSSDPPLEIVQVTTLEPENTSTQISSSIPSISSSSHAVTVLGPVSSSLHTSAPLSSSIPSTSKDELVSPVLNSTASHASASCSSSTSLSKSHSLSKSGKAPTIAQVQPVHVSPKSSQTNLKVMTSEPQLSANKYTAKDGEVSEISPPTSVTQSTPILNQSPSSKANSGSAGKRKGSKESVRSSKQGSPKSRNGSRKSSGGKRKAK